jgi:hypothetical protein
LKYHSNKLGNHSTNSDYRSTRYQQQISTVNMGILAIKGLFHKDSVKDYQDVLVPLANAQRHPTVEAEYARRRSAEGHGSTGDFNGAKKEVRNESSGEEGVMRTTSHKYSPYTIEGLRAEVVEDLASSGHDSSYDCKLI